MGQVYTTDTSWIHVEWSIDEWNDGWSLDEWNDDWSCAGWNEGCGQARDTSVSSFSLESFERVKMKLDTRAAVNTLHRTLVQKEQEMEVSITGSQTVKLGNFQDTMKMVCPDL